MRPLYKIALALCLTAAIPVAHADEASRRVKAEEMLQLTKTDSLMRDQLANLQTRVNAMAKQQSGAAPLSPEQTKLTDEYLKQVQDVTTDEVGWTKLRPIVVQEYADTFTEADLDAIIAFYKTPAGQSVIAKTPELANKTMTAVQTRIKDLQPKLATITQDYSTKMKAAAPTAPATAPAAKPSLTPQP